MHGRRGWHSKHRRCGIRVELRWIAQALRRAGYRGVDPGDGWVDGVSIDTRSDCSGKLFVALIGARTDGHDFIGEALEKGASALLVSAEKLADVLPAVNDTPVFAVPDTLAGLQEMAAAYRLVAGPMVVAVTGTTGKTETKEMITAVVSTRFSVHATPGNFNNHIGLPLTLLGMAGGEKVLVAEMGANHRGEIRRLAEIARPQIGVITNIGPGHLEFFGSLKGVARAKAELVESLPPGGAAVLPADDEFLELLKGATDVRVVTFGFSEGADWRIENVTTRQDQGYTFLLGGRLMEVRLYGKHHLLNAAAAAVVGELLGVAAAEAANAIAAVRAAPGRGVLYDIDGILFFDDTYNSNPASLKAAVDAFMEVPLGGRRWLVLGDMLELGERSAELHAEAGEYCGKSGVDGILTIGDESVELNRAASIQRKAPPQLSHFLEPGKLAAYLDELLEPGDGVLVKGSRGMATERVIDAIERLHGTVKKRVD